MARKISEKELEKIISEAAKLAVERLSFISESKGKQAISEKKINEAVGESLKMVLKEGIFDVFRKKKSQPQQKPQQKSPALPDGVSKDVASATFGRASDEYVPIYVIKTNIGNLYVHIYAAERINSILSQLRQSGIQVYSYDQQRVSNPNWNGASYGSRSGGYGGGYSSGGRQVNHTDQAGHIRAWDDDQASYDAMGR